MTNEQHNEFEIAKAITRAAFGRFMPPRAVDYYCEKCDNTRRVRGEYGDVDCVCVSR